VEKPILSTSKGNESNIKSTMVKFFDSLGIVHQKFAIPGQTSALLVRVFTMYKRAKPPREFETIMKPGLVHSTRQCTGAHFSQCSHYKHGCDPPSSLISSFGHLCLLLVSKNKITAMRALFP
jgi:hypothetical protein